MNFAWEIFLSVAFVYAFLSAFTTLFYKGKPVHSLGGGERDILYGRATIPTRISIFFINLLSSIVAPPVYIISLFIILVYVLIKRYIL